MAWISLCFCKDAFNKFGLLSFCNSFRWGSLIETMPLWLNHRSRLNITCGCVGGGSVAVTNAWAGAKGRMGNGFGTEILRGWRVTVLLLFMSWVVLFVFVCYA